MCSILVSRISVLLNREHDNYGARCIRLYKFWDHLYGNDIRATCNDESPGTAERSGY